MARNNEASTKKKFSFTREGPCRKVSNKPSRNHVDLQESSSRSCNALFECSGGKETE
jgi:hypothetical protein